MARDEKSYNLTLLIISIFRAFSIIVEITQSIFVLNDETDKSSQILQSKVYFESKLITMKSLNQIDV